MRVNIVIPNYNGAHLLGPCLESIETQHYRDYDVTVVDNGSTDDSFGVISRFTKEVRLIKLGENVGFGRAVNLGIQAGDGELVFVLNNDTTLHPTCLLEIIDGVRANPAYGFYAPKICEHEDSSRIYAAGLMFSNRGYGNRSQRHEFGSVNRPVEVFGACGAGAIYRRRVLDAIGLFNEFFFFLFEDVELSFRHQLLGHKCLYLPGAVLYHRGSVTLHKFFPLAVREAVKNSLSTLITCLPTALYKEQAFKIVWFYFLFWAHIIRKGFARELASALLATLSNFIGLLKRRRSLQHYSKIDVDYLRGLVYTGDIYINFPDEVIRL